MWKASPCLVQEGFKAQRESVQKLSLSPAGSCFCCVLQMVIAETPRRIGHASHTARYPLCFATCCSQQSYSLLTFGRQYPHRFVTGCPMYPAFILYLHFLVLHPYRYGRFAEIDILLSLTPYNIVLCAHWSKHNLFVAYYFGQNASMLDSYIKSVNIFVPGRFYSQKYPPYSRLYPNYFHCTKIIF